MLRHLDLEDVVLHVEGVVRVSMLVLTRFS